MTGTDRRALVRPLTALRFLAALWVLLHHALPRGADGSFTAALASSGWLGVSLFFVLSGFLLTVRYAPAGTMRGTRRAFWLERVARLAPAYFLALLFALPLFLRDARVQALGGAATAKVAAAVLTAQQAWRPELACQWDCPAWSLSVEAWFYLAFPLAIALLGGWLMRRDETRRGRGTVVVLLGLAASFAVFPWLERVGSAWMLPVYSLSPLARWPEFLAGIGLAAVLRDWSPAGPRPGLAMFLVGLAWLAGVVALRGTIEGAGLHLLPVALPAFLLLVGGCWGMRQRAALGLDSAALVLLGEASYALYLFHAPLHGYLLALTNRLIGRGYDTSWALFAAYAVAATSLAILVHQRVELPARERLRSRWGLRRSIS